MENFVENINIEQLAELIAQKVYEKMQEELEMYKILAEAEDDIENNRVYPIEDLFLKLEKRFKK